MTAHLDILVQRTERHLDTVCQGLRSLAPADFILEKVFYSDFLLLTFHLQNQHKVKITMLKNILI